MPLGLIKGCIVSFCLLLLSSVAIAETVKVQYRGKVPLDTFRCHNIDKGFKVKRVCYDASEQYMVILEKGTYHHYCEVDRDTVKRLLAATTAKEFFNYNIKGSKENGPFDCRTHRIPKY